VLLNDNSIFCDVVDRIAELLFAIFQFVGICKYKRIKGVLVMTLHNRFLLICGFFVLVLSTHAKAIDFPLPKGNYESAKMPMHLVYPRPDTETQSHARHRWAHSSMKYEIPIGVQGGAWPFKYELIDAPLGATIGNLYGDSNYGVVSWQPPGSGTFTFRVRITDQELNNVDASWQVTVNDSQFVFIQDGHTGPKNGTFQEPLEDVVDWYKNNRTDNTYLNKIVVFRRGDYTLVGSPENNNNIVLTASAKTPSLIGFPGETPVINASQAKIMTDNGSLKDIFVAGIRWESSRQDVNNAHFFWAVGDVSRATWWNNYFYDHGPGLVGNDNTAAVFISSKKSLKNNILYKGNTHENFTNNTSNGAYLDIYYTSYLLIEENIAKNSNPSYGFWAKGTTAFVSIRANEAYDNVYGMQIVVGYGTESPELSHDHEVCWNRIRIPAGKTGTAILLWAVSRAYEGSTFNSYIYRNTFVNGSSWIRFRGNEDYETSGNVVVSNNLNRWDTSIMTATSPNIVGSESAGITDQSGLLIGQYRQNYLGRVGFEVSDLNVVKIPKNPDQLIVQ